MLFKTDYLPLPPLDKEVDTSEELLLPTSRSESSVQLRRSRLKRSWTRYLAIFTHGSLLLLCLLFFSLWIHARAKFSNMYTYSPANSAIENDNEVVVFNGSFRFPSIYRGPPTPELDQAWVDISTGVRLGRLTRDQLLKLGKEDTPSKVKYLPEDGGGYMVALEATHQLHCLNTLRKYLYFDHYSKFDPFFTEAKPETYRTHLEHCLEILRQALMCSADTGMITFEWVRGFSGAYPDFNTKHQCRNFEKLIAWQNANGIQDIPESRIVRQEGEIDLVNPP